jgi:4-diphosphocytidyl-2C-methyl-D-erythritol kinase
MKLKRQIGAKLNLTLDIVGEKNGFHQLKSLVVELSLKDTVIIKGRKDDEVTLKVKGATLPVGEKNTAFKAGKAFVDRYLVPGVDITVIKKIPLG